MQKESAPGKTQIARTQYELTASDLQVVLSLARGGTLAGAAERSGSDPSTVFRALQRLERALGQRLFERTRSGYLPTEAAAEISVHAERIEAELEAARAAASTAAIYSYELATGEGGTSDTVKASADPLGGKGYEQKNGKLTVQLYNYGVVERSTSAAIRAYVTGGKIIP